MHCMLKYYKLDKTFGPVGAIAGVTLFIVGIITLFYSMAGIFLIILGAFVGFTGTGTYIDFENKRIKYTNSIFGFIRVGHWIKIEPTMKLEIKKSNIAWRSYSQSNRTLDISEGDYRLMLHTNDSKELIPLIKAKSLSAANKELELMATQLGI